MTDLTQKTQYSLDDLLAIMRRLRDPNTGCPWDLKQTYTSLLPMTLEEAYEVADAIDRQDWQDLQEELGDVLLHLVFYAQLAQEEQRFAFADVLTSICQKMIRRHPHIFARETLNNAVNDSEDVKQRWEAIKQQEREAKNKHQPDDFFSGITLALPALKHSVKLKKRAATIGFDWENWQQVSDKVREELQEVEQSLHAKEGQARLEEELGDLLFSVANLAAHLKVDPENALRKANRKFSHRVNQMIQLLNNEGHAIKDCDLAMMDQAWERVKKR
ncbi:MAG: nucleoside triphosphate pyrophosphohydrolase, partial [bacterium]